MYNPIRRNRNIGTEKQGLGQNNKLKIASPYGETKAFFERLTDYTKETRTIHNHEFVFITEKTRKNSFHCCSVNDLEKIIQQIPPFHYGELKFIILRQPKKKEELLSPTWGRLIYSYEFENEYFPAIILDAIDITQKIKRSRKLSVHDQNELKRLMKDGHRFTETKRGFIANFEVEYCRNTQLYRTLLHEFGHYVHYLEVVEKPGNEQESYEDWEKRWSFYLKINQDEKEKFAHKYADEMKEKLLRQNIIPFAPL